MTYTNFFMGAIIALCFSSCSEPTSMSNTDLGIIPAPNNIFSSGKVSEINDLKIFIPEKWMSPYYKELYRDINGITWVDDKNTNIEFTEFNELEKEGYRLTISNKKIRIEASGPSGFQHGLVSLAQMVKHNGLPLPQVIIEDSPKFGYRGMHLDVARHFFSVNEVKKYLDYMAYYKYNNFHWHLTEDQGWRIEIKKYPKLQEVAAYRKETLIGHYNDQPHQFDGKRYGGYYTQEEVKDIVAYAAARNINVIPEIEMPGHAQAALAAYPYLGCEPTKKYEVATKWGIFEDVYCFTEETFKFLEDVIDEVIDLFPSSYIHIGGDECPKEAWKKSAFCQELIKKEGLKDEDGLQSYFITRMEKYINSKGRKIIGWDEILEGGLAPNATVMSWRGIEGGIEAARHGHDVIMTPGTHCYFDHYQSDSPDEPVAIGGYTTVEKVYGWEPIPDSLETDKRKHILGGQANVWTEYIPTYAQVEYMAYARGMAMAEALWTRERDYSRFLPRYIRHNDFWASQGANMAFHVFDIKPDIIAGNGEPISINWDVIEGSTIHFTHNDGPSQKVDIAAPFVVSKSGKYNFIAGDAHRKGTPLTLNFDLHKGTKASITLENPPASQYPGNGPGSIINGVIGSDTKYGGTEWLGFSGKDCIGILDFGQKTSMDEVTMRFFKGEGQWIYLPSKVELWSSDDGVNYQKIVEKSNITTPSKIATVTFNNLNLSTQYLKIHAYNFGKIPDGNQGGGHMAWLFVDEIVVR